MLGILVRTLSPRRMQVNVNGHNLILDMTSDLYSLFPYIPIFPKLWFFSVPNHLKIIQGVPKNMGIQ